jgi:hypothetical protein
LEEWQIFLAAKELNISTIRKLTIDEIKDRILETPVIQTEIQGENIEPNFVSGPD